MTEHRSHLCGCRGTAESVRNLREAAHAALDEAVRESLRDARVSVLEDFVSRLYARFQEVMQPGDEMCRGEILASISSERIEMLSEAREAVGMVGEQGAAVSGSHDLGNASAPAPVSHGHSGGRPPSEQPTPRIPLTDEALSKLKEGVRRTTRLTGKDMAVTVGPVPEQPTFCGHKEWDATCPSCQRREVQLSEQPTPEPERCPTCWSDDPHRDLYNRHGSYPCPEKAWHSRKES